MKRFFDLLFFLANVVTPHRFLTRVLGAIADSKTVWLKDFLIHHFISSYQIDLTDLDPPLEKNGQSYPQYLSFNAFFSRRYKQSKYPFSTDACLASPAQGQFSYCQITSDRKITITEKNLTLSIDRLFEATKNYHQTTSIGIIYLSPRDYHCLHAPIGGLVKSIERHHQTLYSVNPRLYSYLPELLDTNDRITVTFELDDRTCYSMVLVGASIVGMMELECTIGQKVAKGALIARFLLGSTVILLLPKSLEFQANLSSLTPGQPITSCKRLSL